MKYSEFNKFGGTELRCCSQVKVYSLIIFWVIDNSFCSGNVKDDNLLKERQYFTKKEWEKKFLEWCKREEIYNYQSTSIERFKMVISNLTKKIPVLKELHNKGKYSYQFENKSIEQDWNEMDKNGSINNFFFKYCQKGSLIVNKAFYAMIDFLFQNPTKNDAETLALCFMVWDEKDNFSNLYSLGKQSILNNITNNYFNLFLLGKDQREWLNFRKPSYVESWISKIIDFKKNNLTLTNDVFSDYDYKKDNYIRKIIFGKNQNFNLTTFVQQLNNININDFVYKLIYNKFRLLLNNEYFDLFNRWMFDFKIAKSSSINNKNYDSSIICDQGDIYALKIYDKPFTFPYDKEKVKKYLERIMNNDFSFKNYDDNLKFIGNSTIAEYFVNVWFCFKFNVNPSEFKKYVYTKVTEDLFPVFTAPSKVPDMCYYDEKRIHNIETTILSTQLEIEKNEIFPCLNHLKFSKNNFDNLNAKKTFLTFVSPFSKEIEPRFRNNFHFEFKDDKMNVLQILKLQKEDFLDFELNFKNFLEK